MASPTRTALNPHFPEESAIQEISGVIGGSVDRTVKFVVERVVNDPMMFHIWLGFKHELLISHNVMVEAITLGVSKLEHIGLWEE